MAKKVSNTKQPSFGID